MNTFLNKDTTTQWQQPRPLPGTTLPLRELALSDLPKSCQPFLEDITFRLQCPLEYAAAPLIVGFSALVGRRLALRIYDYDDWLVVPNLWGAVIGPPGSMKTAAFRRALLPLQELQTAAFADYHAALAAYEEKRSRYHRADPNRLRLSMPTCRRYIVGDVTLPKLADLLRENPCGLLYFRDDLVGWLRAMNRDRHESARAFYRQAFSQWFLGLLRVENGLNPAFFDFVKVFACLAAVLRHANTSESSGKPQFCSPKC